MSAVITTDVRQAALTLLQGGLVAFATETVYGLGANALDPLAVARVFAAKGRPRFDPLIVHLASVDDVSRVVRNVPEVASRLMARFWPGPMTLVLPKLDLVPDLVTAGLSTVGVRVPDHPQARELIRISGVPVAAPSANPFGRVSPTTAEHVQQQLGEEIDLILDGGPCRVGLESTVLQIRNEGPPLLLRAGGLTIEEIEAEIGPVKQLTAATISEQQPQLAPGMLSRHYAPVKRLVVIDDWKSAPRGPKVGVISLSPVTDVDQYGFVEVLSTTGSLIEAAANFFAALRRLDAADITTIVATRFPDHGLGRALNDRLTRAAR